MDTIRLGQRVRFVRKRRGFTLREVAQKMEASVPFLSMVEHGKSGITLESLVALASALSVSPAAILEDRLPAELIVSVSELIETIIHRHPDPDRIAALTALL